MSILIDILLIVIAVINVIVFTKRGFLQSVFKSGRKIIAIILAVFLGSTVGKFFYDLFVYNGIYGWIEPKVIACAGKIEELPFIVRAFIPAGADAVGAPTRLSETLASSVAGVISDIIGYILVFIAALLLLKLIKPLIDLITKIPIVHGVNAVLGFALGIVASFFLLMLLTFLLGGAVKLFAGGTAFASAVSDSWMVEFFNGTTL